MKIILDRPPMWEQINATFGIGNKPIIFSWGNIIYNPNGGKVTRELHAHEEIHGARQGLEESGIVAWWERYLIDPAFRLEEELPAHRAEYLAYTRRHGGGREKYLLAIARRLCGPLYGNLLTMADARTRILIP